MGEAHDGEIAVALDAELVPDVVLMDIKLPGMNGNDATRQILSANPDCVVLAMSLHTEPRLVEVALGAGAVGYVAKDAAGDGLVNAIRTVAAGGRPPAPRI